jgi:WD40 repeat protein
LILSDDPVAWSVRTGAVTKRFEISGRGDDVEVSAAGTVVATVAGGCQHLIAWDARTAAVRQQIAIGTPQACHLSFTKAAVSPDGRWLVWAGLSFYDDEDGFQRHDAIVRLYDAASGTLRREWTVPRSSVESPTFTADGRGFLVSHDGGARLYDTVGLTSTNTGIAAYRLAYSPDGRYLAATDYYHRIMFYDARSLELLREVSVEDRPNDLAWSPDGSRLAVAYGNDDHAGLKIFDASTGFRLRSLMPDDYSGEMVAVAWSSNGEYLAGSGFYWVNGSNGTQFVKVWRPLTGELVWDISGDERSSGWHLRFLP